MALATRIVCIPTGAIPYDHIGAPDVAVTPLS